MGRLLRPSTLVPRGFAVDDTATDGEVMMIRVRPVSRASLCPGCGTRSERIHSRYQRRLADLPLAGKSVRLVIAARRFHAAAEFLEHAKEEQEHADRIAARIVQLGGEPDFSPHELARRSHAEYVEGRDLAEMIREDLIAERIAIASYTELVRYFGSKDPTSRVLMESILATEEEHAEDMSSLLEGFSGQTISAPAAERQGSRAGSARAPADSKA
jgi:bacterioferritin (cytochrome b1)